MADAEIPIADFPPGPRLQASRGILLTQGLRLGVRVITAGGMARMVTPQQYGLFGMALLVHGLATVVQDFGLGALTMRKPVLPEDERTAFFWLNVMVGTTLALIVASLGPVTAAFYHEPILGWMLPILALTLLVNGLHAQLRAQLAREHRFTELNRIEIASFLICSAVGLLTARLGAGAWALVWLLVSAEIVIAIGAWLTQRWRPGPWPRGFSPRSALAIGAGLSGHEILRYLQRNTDQFFISRRLGPAPLGLYGRALQLATLPGQYLCEPLAPWVLSTLGRLHDSTESARAFWGRIVNGLAHITLPFAVMIFCLPAEVLRLFFGPAWITGAPILRGLSGLVIAQPLLVAEAWLLIATGHSRRLLTWSGLTLLAVAATCSVTVNAGAAILAAGVSLVLLLSAGVGAVFALRDLPAQARDLMKALFRPLALAATAILLITGLFAVIPLEGTILRFAAGALLTVGCWGLAWWWPDCRTELREHFLLHRR